MKRANLYSQLLSRLLEARRFIQVLAGLRQVGKTTLVRLVMQECGVPAHYASADEPTLRDHVSQDPERLNPAIRISSNRKLD